MGETVRWERDLAAAVAKAREEKKTVLADFFNPG